MTLLEVFDRLHGHRISRVEFKDGDPLVCAEPTLVVAEPTNALTEVWLLVEPDGLSLSFNAKDENGQWQAHTEPLANITSIV
jgi:hypothetical protein